MLGRMGSGGAEPLLSSANANAPAQAAEGMPGVVLPGTPSSAGRKSFAGPAANAADPVPGGTALGDARKGDAVAKDSAANPRTLNRPRAPAPKAAGLLQATLSRRLKGAMPQPVDSKATSAAPPLPSFSGQAETIAAPSCVPVNAAVPGPGTIPASDGGLGFGSPVLGSPAAIIDTPFATMPPSIATRSAGMVSQADIAAADRAPANEMQSRSLPVESTMVVSPATMFPSAVAPQASPDTAGVEATAASEAQAAGLPGTPTAGTGLASVTWQASTDNAMVEGDPASASQGRAPSVAAMLMPPGMSVQVRSGTAEGKAASVPDTQPGAPADPAGTAGASSGVAAEPSAAIMGPRISIAFAMQAYGLQGAASPATSTKPGGSAPAADTSAVGSPGEPASGQAAVPLPGGPGQALQAASPPGAPLQSASGTGEADTNGLAAPPGSLPPHPGMGAHGLALPTSPVVVRVASPVQSTQATRSDPVREAAHAASEPGVIARAGDAPGPAGANIAAPGPAGAAVGVLNGALPGGGSTATGQPLQAAAVLPGMPAAHRNASQVQPGHAAGAPLGHGSRDMPAGSPARLPPAGAGPDAVAVSPVLPGVAEPGAEAARLAAAAGPALMGMTSPAPPAFAQTASTAAGVDAAPAPPAMQQVAQVFAAPNLPQRMTLQLAPAELGAVQIGIERAPNGPATVTLLVERADTLLLLMRDQPALHRALDAAGLAAEGRTLHFGLAQPGPANTTTTPIPASAGGSGPASLGAGRDGSAPGGSQAGGSQTGGSQSGGSQGGSQGGGQGRGGYQPSAESGSGRPSAHTPHRTGIDFTA